MSSSHLIQENEQANWLKFAAGDNQALEEIYRTYYQQLYTYGYKWLRNSTLVEDCIQDLFIKLMRNRENLALPNSVRNYLFTSLRMMALDKLKGRSYDVLFLDEEHGKDFPLEWSFDEEMIRNEEDKIRYRRLQEALDTLTPRQREAIFLRYIQGISYEEVSGILELSPKATYKLVARALASLKEILVIAWLLWVWMMKF